MIFKTKARQGSNDSVSSNIVIYLYLTKSAYLQLILSLRYNRNSQMTVATNNGQILAYFTSIAYELVLRQLHYHRIRSACRLRTYTKSSSVRTALEILKIVLTITFYLFMLVSVPAALSEGGCIVRRASLRTIVVI